jgi:hypothetical protein
MMVVSYTVEEDRFRAGKPEVLFEGRFAFGNTRFADITPDGKRFVMLQSAEEEGAAESQTLGSNR